MSFVFILQFIACWVMSSLFLYLILLFTQELRLRNIFAAKNSDYLLVTAHPDDECMFFGPLIGNLMKWQVKLRLLCLSSGNFYGIGDLRRRELFEAAEALGLSPDKDVTLIDDPRLPDSMQQSWPADAVFEYVNEIKPKPRPSVSFVTFDSLGITKHPNHVSIYRALFSPECEKKQLFSLISIPFFVQYTGSLTCLPIVVFIWLFSLAFGKNSHIVVASPNQWLNTIRAMACHKSQLMWFRYLHLMLSSYLLVNIYEQDNSALHRE